MTRLIDADALAKFIDYGHLNNPNEKLYSENDIREMIEMMPTIDAVPRWIPCSERLPEEKGEYLVTYHPCYWDNVWDDIKVGIDSFRGKTAWAKKKHQRVIAWMPLPEPYEVERT